ncbi:DgyrCDS4168 [Dimorphilus gyrociliatus]|uniref:DgyrCDS4168 n=1 Tax=Dimorphilus gyrociliatus TaxID=2664684 RepID=A0A7I8VIS5_9ANNE|nr:DgyrCDS4168 [Dimorphilus gyrociliatus]
MYLQKRSLTTIKSWSFDTDPFGSLSLFSKRFADVYIRTLDPQAFPQMNKVFIDVVSANDMKELKNRELDLNVSMNSKFRLNISTESEMEDNFKILIRMPIKFEIEASICGNKKIEIADIENYLVQVTTEDGDCLLKNIKTADLSLSSIRGNIHCFGSLLAASKIQTKSGDVTIGKCLGPQLNIKGETGKISISSLYSEKSSINSQSGDIQIKHCHKDCSITSKGGSIQIGCLSGNLKCKSEGGNLDLYVENTTESELALVGGHANLKLSEKLKSILDLEAKDINMTENIPFIPLEQNVSHPKVVGVITDEENIKDDHFVPKDVKIPKSIIKAHSASGTISVSIQNWFQSLQLSMLEKKQDD